MFGHQYFAGLAGQAAALAPVTIAGGIVMAAGMTMLLIDRRPRIPARVLQFPRARWDENRVRSIRPGLE